MRSSTLLRLVTVPYLVTAYAVQLPSNTAPGTSEDCTSWHVATDSDTCDSIEGYWYITDLQFTTYVCFYPHSPSIHFILPHHQ
jgi:hypothetical protein